MTSTQALPQPQQLFLLPQPIAPPVVSIERVCDELKLGDDRHYVTVRQGDRCWHYPIQFRSDELRLLVPQILRWNWSLSDAGVPIELDSIHRGFEFLVDRLPSVGEVSK